jgi:hypothetical protein
MQLQLSAPSTPLPALRAGGDQIRALNWALHRGGLATQADYPYQGVNNFCRTDVAQKRFKGGCGGMAARSRGAWAMPRTTCLAGRRVRVMRQGGCGALLPLPLHRDPTAAPGLTAGNWVLVEGGEAALKEAVLTRGPMIVSSERERRAPAGAVLAAAALSCGAQHACATHMPPLCWVMATAVPCRLLHCSANVLLSPPPPLPPVDASHDSFRFYAGGIYSHPDCATQPADLDHAVIIRCAGRQMAAGVPR